MGKFCGTSQPFDQLDDILCVLESSLFDLAHMLSFWKCNHRKANTEIPSTQKNVAYSRPYLQSRTAWLLQIHKLFCRYSKRSFWLLMDLRSNHSSACYLVLYPSTNGLSRGHLSRICGKSSLFALFRICHFFPATHRWPNCPTIGNASSIHTKRALHFRSKNILPRNEYFFCWAV